MARKKKPPTPLGAGGKELGSSGLNISHSGTIDDDHLEALRGTRKYKVFRQMADDDPIVGASLAYITMLGRGSDWTVEANPDGNPEDAEFLESCLDDMSHTWGDFVAEAFSMLTYGFAAFEIVYKRRSGYQKPGSKNPTSKHNDGRIGWRKLALRGQSTVDRWVFDDSNGVSGLVQKAPPYFRDVEIPIEKLLLFRTVSDRNNPEGRSILRSAYRPWFYRQRLEQIEGAGIERDLNGIPKIWVDPKLMRADATAAERAQLATWERFGSEIRADKRAYVLLPNLRDSSGRPVYDIELMTSGGNGKQNVGEAISRYRAEIAMALLTDFILLGHEQVGSLALSSDKTSLFAVAIGTYLDVIQDTINRHLVPRLLLVNGRDVSNPPKIVHGDIEKQDVSALVDMLSRAAQAGLNITPDVEVEHQVRELAGLPAKSAAATKEAIESEKFAIEQSEEVRRAAKSEQSPLDAAFTQETTPTEDVLP